MDRSEYKKMYLVEESMWWYAGLHANLLAALQAHLPSYSEGALLDAGCGTGALLTKLRHAFSHLFLVGLDVDADACVFAAGKSAQPVCEGTLNSLPFADGSFVAIVSADVLYHRSVDERRALLEFRRCLVPQGVLVINVPAYQWLYSSHDRAVHTARRYTRWRLRAALEDAGFCDIQTTHWNTILFPLMVLHRVLTRRGATSDVVLYPGYLERCFRAVMQLETRFLKSGMIFPYGGSILATATRG